jgi:hypothetical protein
MYCGVVQVVEVVVVDAVTKTETVRNFSTRSTHHHLFNDTWSSRVMVKLMAAVKP